MVIVFKAKLVPLGAEVGSWKLGKRSMAFGRDDRLWRLKRIASRRFRGVHPPLIPSALA